MIELKVADYCHGCTEFVAKTMTGVLWSGKQKPEVVDHIVVCENNERCNRIKAYLEQRAAGFEES